MFGDEARAFSLMATGMGQCAQMTKVLMVDDEPSILHSTGLLLQALGFQVVTTADPKEVLPMLRRERPEVLLQDVRMPGLDIDALLQSIRKDPEVGATPVILFSASMDIFEVQDRVGATGFLEKPFRPTEVAQAIQDAVRKNTVRVQTTDSAPIVREKI